MSSIKLNDSQTVNLDSRQDQESAVAASKAAPVWSITTVSILAIVKMDAAAVNLALET